MTDHSEAKASLKQEALRAGIDRQVAHWYLSMPKFDVVVPTFNNVDQLRRCLASLERQTEGDIRVVVCVDGSTDGTFEYLDALPLELSTLTLEHPDRANRGRAATRNLALPQIASRYVLLLDSDMVLEPTAIAEHRAVLERGAGASVGSITYVNASTNLWARYLSVRRLNRWPQGAALPWNQFASANAALSSDDFIALRGFDEAMSGYGGEDTEFGYRLTHELGRTIRSNPAASAISVEDKSIHTALEQFREFGRTNLRYALTKHPAMPHVFFTDRLGSRRPRDRLFVATMNPITDWVVRLLLPRVPFSVQHQLINYAVIRAVCAGFAEGAES